MCWEINFEDFGFLISDTRLLFEGECLIKEQPFKVHFNKIKSIVLFFLQFISIMKMEIKSR